MKKRKNIGIKDINKIRKQYQAGLSIRHLSIYWDIPYATLYRKLKGRGKKLNKN